MNEARIELLAPAKDASIGRTAILCGADAVYIGAERFSARQAAGNSLATIASLVDFAHPYNAKVYVALNTILRDDELMTAEKIAREMHAIGADGLIVQDVGLLELELPPIPLIASTQMHNATAQRVRFWQDIGFSRAILARELTLDQIREIRAKTTIELECFVHGALCVGTSGRCYMSYALGGRSGNRGQCAQPCRRRYTLRDRDGAILAKDRYLLSLRDLNLSDHLEDLIDAGVTSFKIEGRLKDQPYVANTVAFYREQLDTILAKRNKKRSSSGTTYLDFQPNPAKTFNRGFTHYSLTGRSNGIASMDSPKSVGELIGLVSQVSDTSFTLDTTSELHNADGICFFDRDGNLSGSVVNRVEGNRVYPDKMLDIREGQQIYRNYDHEFVRRLNGRCAKRKIRLVMSLKEESKHLLLGARDEDGNEATVEIQGTRQPARNQNAAKQTVVTQLTKLGNTLFECVEVQLQTSQVYFLPVSQLNDARRRLVQDLLTARLANRPRLVGALLKNDVVFPEKRLTYTENVLNESARRFYKRHGVDTIEPAAESGLDLSRRVVMTTKHCLRRELGLCVGSHEEIPAEPLFLEDENGTRFELQFICRHCGMEIALGGGW